MPNDVYLCSYAVIRFDVFYWTMNATDFQCNDKRKWTVNVNIYIYKKKRYLLGINCVYVFDNILFYQGNCNPNRIFLLSRV